MSGYINEPAPYSVAITPSDATIYDPPLRKLWVGVTGHLAVRLSGMSTAVTLSNVPVGMIDDLRIAQVMATNTTATTMVGFW